MKGRFFLSLFLKLTGGVRDIDGVTVPRLGILCFPPFLILWWGGIYAADFSDYVLFRIARGLGLYWFYLESKFKFKDKVIRRPKHFNSRELREAFGQIGSRAATLMGSNGREDDYWFDPARFFEFGRPYPNNTEKEREARQRALDLFVSEGILLKRWRLGIGNEYHITSMRMKPVPQWDAQGNRLVDGGMDPTRLTDEERTELIGKDYAVTPLFFTDPWEEENFPPMKRTNTEKFENGCRVIRIDKVPDLDRPQTIEEEMNRRRNLPKYKVTENDFTPVHLRPREVVL